MLWFENQGYSTKYWFLNLSKVKTLVLFCLKIHMKMSWHLFCYFDQLSFHALNDILFLLNIWKCENLGALTTRPVVLKPVLEYPQPCTFCMSPSSITPDSTHQLISGDRNTWSRCVRYEETYKYWGYFMERIENHCTRLLTLPLLSLKADVSVHRDLIKLCYNTMNMCTMNLSQCLHFMY